MKKGILQELFIHNDMKRQIAFVLVGFPAQRRSAVISRMAASEHWSLDQLNVPDMRAYGSSRTK